MGLHLWPADGGGADWGGAAGGGVCADADGAGEDSAGVSKLCLRLDTAVHGGSDAGAVHRERGRAAARGAVRRGDPV